MAKKKKKKGQKFKYYNTSIKLIVGNKYLQVHHRWDCPGSVVSGFISVVLVIRLCHPPLPNYKWNTVIPGRKRGKYGRAESTKEPPTMTLPARKNLCCVLVFLPASSLFFCPGSGILLALLLSSSCTLSAKMRKTWTRRWALT